MKSALVLVGSRSSILSGWTSKAINYDYVFLLDRDIEECIGCLSRDVEAEILSYSLDTECEADRLKVLLRERDITSIDIIWSAYDGSMLSESYSSRSAAVEGFWKNCGHPVQFLYDLMSLHLDISCVFIGSMYGGYAPNKNIYTKDNCINPLFYGVYKAGLAQAAKWLSAQSVRCRVNCVMVGAVPKVSVRSDEKFVEALTKLIPALRQRPSLL